MVLERLNENPDSILYDIPYYNITWYHAGKTEKSSGFRFRIGTGLKKIYENYSEESRG